MPTFRVPLAVVIGAVAFWLVLVITEPMGPGLDPDTVSYVGAAISLVHNKGLQVPNDDWESSDSTTALVHFPPGFSAAIAIPLALGMPAIQSARLIEASAAFISMALVAWLVSDCVGVGAGIIAALTIIATPAIAGVHENVLSEPLFLALLMVVLTLMVRSPRRPFLAGVAAAAASLVRYAGVSTIAAVGVWWLLFVERASPLRQRVRHAVLALLPGVIVQGLWVLRSVHANHEESIRSLSLYGELGPTLREGGMTVTAWLAPLLDGNAAILGAVIVSAVLIALGVSIWRLRQRVISTMNDASTHLSPLSALQLLAALAVLAVMYVGVVVASRLFADPGIPLDERLLAPFILLVEIGVGAGLGIMWRAWSRPIRILVAAGLVMWWGASLWMTRDDVRSALETGNDYADMAWRSSPLIAWVREHGAGRTLFTNFPAALYFHVDRMARLLPQEEEVTPAMARVFADTLVRQHGLIVAFDRSSEFVENPARLLRLLPVKQVAAFRDGAVWEVQ